jgi:hypothetical protein
MANLYWVYNIHDRVFQSGPYPSSADATTALRKNVVKSGSRANDKVNVTKAADFEVITVTAP